MGSSAVRILGRLWRIRRTKGLKSEGLTTYAKALIEVKPGLDPFERKEVVLHELMHAILYQQGREDHGCDVEETYVRPLALGILAVFQDNPELAAWLAAPITRR